MRKIQYSQVTHQQKLKKLHQLIESYPSAAVAFSGGVDSSLLARVAYDVLGERSLALTVETMLLPRRESDVAPIIAERIGIPFLVLSVDNLSDKIVQNDRDRCYHCKKLIFSNLRLVAEDRGMAVVLDGSNVDDLSDYRPGMRALAELQVMSPFIECGLTKKEIRELSRALGLSTWDKPSMACMASRVEYGQRITRQILSRIEQAETFLHELGLRQVRVRCHGNLARIEVAPDELEKLLVCSLFDQVNRRFKALGFQYVTLDMEGYATGRMNA